MFLFWATLDGTQRSLLIVLRGTDVRNQTQVLLHTHQKLQHNQLTPVLPHFTFLQLVSMCEIKLISWTVKIVLHCTDPLRTNP